MLNMIKSNRMEGLMDGLAAVLAQVPEDPMAPEWIGIQSRGMKQWIATQVTQRFGVCANLSFLFPRQMIELFFTSPGTRQDLLLSEDVLMWSIMETIHENGATPCFASLENYIAGDLSGRRLFQLSMKIARVFDDYQVYRPQMLLDWEKTDENTRFADPVMAWQSLIWKRVAVAWPHTHVAARMEELIKQAALGRQDADKGSGLPIRISLFGVSAMPPRFLELFGALSRTMDIYLFLLTPSDQFFFDITSLRQMEKMGLAQAEQNQTDPDQPGPDQNQPDQNQPDQTGLLDPDPDYYEIANPLLASLGRSGREFHGSLEAFEQDPDLHPHEVIVMMPDIEAYAPYLKARLLGKIAHFGYTLFERLSELSAPKTITGWGESFKTLIGSMMEKTFSNEADMGFLIQTIDEFIREGETAGYGRTIDFCVVREIIETKLDKTISQGNFLAGSLTFCNLMPMRSIPFKVVALMGMDEQSFPRKAGAVGFDLMKKYPKMGDKQERDEDQYLFLESLLSARDRLIITYTGMSIKDNSPIPCSGVVEELKDVITQSFEFPKGVAFCFEHPLHPFSQEYFGPGGAFFSFSQDQCKIAMSQAEREKRGNSPEPTPFLPRGFCLVERGKYLEKQVPLEKGTAAVRDSDQAKRGDGQKSTVTLAELVRFFRKPIESFVTQGLNLSFPDIEESTPDREAFQLSGLSRYGLGSYYMDKTPATDLYPLVRAGGLLPFGQKGRSEWERVKALANPVLSLVNTLDIGEAMPPLGVDTRVGDFRITGSINDLYSAGRFVAGFGRLTPARLLTQWIYHLFLNSQTGQGTPPPATPGLSVRIPRENCRPWFIPLVRWPNVNSILKT